MVDINIFMHEQHLFQVDNFLWFYAIQYNVILIYQWKIAIIFIIGQSIKMTRILTWETSSWISCIFASSSIDCWVRGGGWTWYLLSFTCNLWIRCTKNGAYSKSFLENISISAVCQCRRSNTIIRVFFLIFWHNWNNEKHLTNKRECGRVIINLPEAIVQKAFNRACCCNSNALLVYNSRTIDSFVLG